MMIVAALLVEEVAVHPNRTMIGVEKGLVVVLVEVEVLGVHAGTVRRSHGR